MYLPFSDDVREPEADPSFMGDSCTPADERQIEAARALLEGLYYPKDDPYQYWEMHNPALQRHYEVNSLFMDPSKLCS